jgi:hypothetical protein
VCTHAEVEVHVPQLDALRVVQHRAVKEADHERHVRRLDLEFPLGVGGEGPVRVPCLFLFERSVSASPGGGTGRRSYESGLLRLALGRLRERGRVELVRGGKERVVVCVVLTRDEGRVGREGVLDACPRQWESVAAASANETAANRCEEP